MDKKVNTKRKVVVKYHTKKDKAITKNGFFSLNSIGNCTICKISIALLIAASFIIVKPQPQIKYQNNFKKDTLISDKSDTLRIVKFMGIAPAGIILNTN